MEIQFNKLENADLIIDCVYKGGTVSNLSVEPLYILFPKCGTSGGFRKVNRCDGSGKPAYSVIMETIDNRGGN